MKKDNFRSPLFYMGDKFKLLDQLKDKFPKIKEPCSNFPKNSTAIKY